MSKVRIVFLGHLRELAGEAEREARAPLDWDGLLDAVGPQVAEQVAKERVHVACAGEVLADKTALSANAGEEVALLPPVSGG